jgi:uncharacterized protein (TIGR03067 family)
MKMRLFLAFSLVLNLVTPTPLRADDAAALQGTWLIVSAELGGVRQPPEVATNIVLKMADGKYEVTVNGHPDKGTWKIDPSSKPKTMDITGTEGPNTGRTIPAIYELKGDQLKICYGLRGSPRPADFKSNTGTHEYLVVYHRKLSRP